MATQIVTANRLTDGAVLYLDPVGNWSTRITQAWVARDETESASLLALAEQPAQGLVVVGPYLMEVVESNGHIAPASLREIIRATGPTAGSDSGKQDAA